MSIFIENLSYAYGETTILNNINITVQAGEKIGIIGVSGGGKSTLLKLISGLYKLQTGVIEVNLARRQEDIRQNVAMVMQNTALFPASIKENITCGHLINEEKLKGACCAAQISEWIASLPEGIDTFVGERGTKVSGGQAQRIAIARAIVKDVPVILLDEATSALDQDTSNAVLSSVKRLTEGKTVISVSHNPDTLIDCNRIFRLEGGGLYLV